MTIDNAILAIAALLALLALATLFGLAYLGLRAYRSRAPRSAELAAAAPVQETRPVEPAAAPATAAKAAAPVPPPAPPAPAPAPAARPAAPAPPVDGADDDSVTELTLAVNTDRPFLKRVSGPGGGKPIFFLSVTGVTTIGRGTDNDVILKDDGASGSHCRIEKQASGYVLIDDGSTNKTFVNGHEKDRVVLRNGDTIKIGATTLIFALFGDRS
jgi:pSer/pThr/pTyr-binding forkhead associated (FHA) protein